MSMYRAIRASIFAFFAIAVCVLGLSSCAQSEDDDGANSALVVSGTITVPDATAWTTLKIGLFSGGTAGNWPGLDTDDGDTNSAADFRVVYEENDDGSDVSIPRVADTKFKISGSGDTSRKYTFELPKTIPGEDITYYYAAWQDANGNGAIDLKDSSVWFDTTIAVQGEFNRCANKATTDNDDAPTVIAITGFLQSTNLETGNLRELISILVMT